jgi:hypothetical protein
MPFEVKRMGLAARFKFLVGMQQRLRVLVAALSLLVGQPSEERQAAFSLKLLMA